MIYRSNSSDATFHRKLFLVENKKFVFFIESDLVEHYFVEKFLIEFILTESNSIQENFFQYNTCEFYVIFTEQIYVLSAHACVLPMYKQNETQVLLCEYLIKFTVLYWIFFSCIEFDCAYRWYCNSCQGETLAKFT